MAALSVELDKERHEFEPRHYANTKPGQQVVVVTGWSDLCWCYKSRGHQVHRTAAVVMRELEK